MPRGDRRRTIAQQLADTRRRLATAERHVAEADAELELVQARYDRADERATALLDELLAAQAERDDARRERHRLRERRRLESERAERLRAAIGVLEERQRRGLR